MTVRVAAYWARADFPGKGHVPFFSYCHMQYFLCLTIET